MKNLLICSASLLAPAFYGVAAEQSSKQPDILFIFVDDMTYDGIRALGNRQVITPNLDALARSGVSFQNTYNMGAWNGAVSMASRTQLMTGKFVWNAYAEQKKDKFKGIIKNRQTWPQIMSDAGYKSYHTGKWHVSGVDPAKLYDEVEAVRPGMPADNQKTTRKGYNRPLSREDNSWQPWDETQGGFWQGGKHWSEVQADLIIAYMERNETSQKPLFMTCAFNAPHDPRQSPKKYVDMYDVDKIKLPKSYQPSHPYMEQMRSGTEVRDEQLAPFPRTEYAVKKHTQEYYAIITHLDEQVGRIMEALKKSKRADNTLIIFTADNGLAMGQHSFLGKQSVYEHSVRIPLILSGCGIKQNQTREQRVYMQDIIPTMYDFAGIEIPQALDFKSLKTIIDDPKAESEYEYTYCAYMDRQRSISDGRYKLMMILEAKKFYLFDLKQDPFEMNDLSESKKHKCILKRLSDAYKEKEKEMNDPEDASLAFSDLFN